MNIGFVVRRPTQFEAPFYRHVADTDPINKLHIFFMEAPADWVLDRETGLFINWGIDLYSGYGHDFLSIVNLDQDVSMMIKGAYDLIIINGYKNYCSQLANRLKKQGITVALRLDTVQFNQSALSMILRKLILRSAYRLFDKYLVTGTASKHYLLEIGIAKERIYLFPYGTDPVLFNRALRNSTLLKQKMQGEKPVILVVAKFIHRENPMEVIDAFGQLNDPNLLLILAGDGKLRGKMEKKAREYSHLAIRFTGYIPYTELPEYYRMASVFIHSARNEPWGVSIQEAISSGCKVICSDKVGAGYDLVAHGWNGFIYPAGRSTLLAECIKKCLRIPGPMAEEANAKILARWNYSATWQNLLQAAGENPVTQPAHFAISGL